MLKQRIKSSLFGLAIGDALGVPVEFKSRSYLKLKPLNKMFGYGTHDQPPGTFSDDAFLLFVWRRQ
jgi:ADP-ribosyl-[dinitrogen reductase] hydrolase